MAQPRHLSHFIAESEKCLSAATFADFTIKTTSSEFKVNRQTLSCHSEYFKTLFATNFKESEERYIELKDDDEAAVSRMIDYFYTFDYDDEGFIPGDHVELYLLADKYNAPGLKQLALDKFASSAMEHYENASQILPAIILIYRNPEATTCELRKAALNAWLCGDRTPADEEKRAELVAQLSQIPEFTAKLALLHAESYAQSYSGFTVRCTCGSSIKGRTLTEKSRTGCSRCGSKTALMTRTVQLNGSMEVEPQWNQSWLREDERLEKRY